MKRDEIKEQMKSVLEKLEELADEKKTLTKSYKTTTKYAGNYHI